MSSHERSRRTIGISELAASLGVSPFEVLSSLGLDLGRIRKALQDHGHEGLDESAALTALIQNMHLELRPARANGSLAGQVITDGANVEDDAAAAASRQLTFQQRSAPSGREPEDEDPSRSPALPEPPSEAPAETYVPDDRSPAIESPFGHFIGLVRTYRWTFLAATLVVFAATMLLSLRIPASYYAEAAVLVEPDAGASDGRTGTVNMATQAELVQSNLIASRVVSRLGLDADPESIADKLSVDLPEDTEILELGYTAGSPEVAEERAQAFVDEYLSFRADQAERASANERAAIDEEIATLQTRLDEINQGLVTATGSEASRLEAEANQISSRIVERQLRLNAISVESSVGVVLRDASASFDPVAPDHLQNGILGLLAGLVLAGSLVVLRDRFDDRVHAPDEIAEVVGRPVMIELPPHPRAGLGARTRLPALQLPDSVIAASYRALAVDLTAAGLVGQRPLLVTAAQKNAGATAVTGNLGIVLARAGKRVLLVDADVRGGGLGARFQLTPALGLAELVGGHAKLSRLVVPTDVERLDLLHPGEPPGGGSEAFAVDDLRRVAERLQQRYDVVIFDAPAVTEHPDMVAFVASVPDVLLVAQSGAPRRSLVYATRAIRKANGTVRGTVVTKVGAAWASMDA